MPGSFDGLGTSLLSQILALQAMRRAQQVFQEIFMTLTQGPQQIGAPHKKVSRPVLRGIGIFTRHLQAAGFQLLSHIILDVQDRKSTRLNSSHVAISYAVFCLKKKIKRIEDAERVKPI